MSRNFLTSLNLNKNELLNAAIQSLANEPNNPVIGQIYFDTQANHLRQWDGSQWLDYITAEAGAGYITDSDSANFTVTDQKLYLNPDVTLGGSAGSAYGSLTILDASGNVTFQSGTDGGPYTNVQGYLSVNYPTNGYVAFSVDSGSAITTVRNVLNAVTDDNIPTVALNGNDMAIYFANPAENQTGYIQTDNSNNFVVNASLNDLVLNSYNADLTLNADGAIRPLTNVYQADGYSITSGNNFYSKASYIGGSDSGANGYFQISTGNDAIQFAVTADYMSGTTADLYGKQRFYRASSAGGAQYAEITSDSGSNLVITANQNDVILNPDSGYAYIGNNSSPATRIATQSYVDGLVQGLNVKDSVRVATASSEENIVDFADVSVIDGVTLADGDRVLLKNQSTSAENGIYVYDLATTTLSRAEDQPTVDKGDYVLVTNGTYAATGWIATSATTWTQFSAANEYTAGNGIDITANTISVALDSDSLSVSGSGLKVNYHTDGGLDNDSGLYVKTAGGVIIDNSGNVALDTDNGYGVRKAAYNNGALTATSGAVTWTVTHNFGTRDVTVQLFDLATYEQIEVDVVRTDGNVVTLSWVSGNVSADSYRVVIVG
jgi:hypothetical protein